MFEVNGDTKVSIGIAGVLIESKSKAVSFKDAFCVGVFGVLIVFFSDFGVFVVDLAGVCNALKRLEVTIVLLSLSIFFLLLFCVLLAAVTFFPTLATNLGVLAVFLAGVFLGVFVTVFRLITIVSGEAA